jgi:hypothetical protein
MRLPYPNDPGGVASVSGIALALGLVGAYCGALARWLGGRLAVEAPR